MVIELQVSCRNLFCTAFLQSLHSLQPCSHISCFAEKHFKISDSLVSGQSLIQSVCGSFFVEGGSDSLVTGQSLINLFMAISVKGGCDSLVSGQSLF